jgi:hypothetical protein
VAGGSGCPCIACDHANQVLPRLGCMQDCTTSLSHLHSSHVPLPIDLGRLSRPVSPWSPTRGQTIPPFPLLQAHPTQHVIVATCTSLLLLDNSPAPFSHSISLPVRGHPQCATCTPARARPCRLPLLTSTVHSPFSPRTSEACQHLQSEHGPNPWPSLCFPSMPPRPFLLSSTLLAAKNRVVFPPSHC